MQIKHGGCCLSARRHMRALINLCNFSRREWGCYRFCVTGWAPEHRLIAYGWIIHMRDEIAGQLHGPCQWRLTRRVLAIVRRWRGWKWSVLTSLHQPLFSSPPAPRHLALIHPIFLFFSPRLRHIQISADEITSTAAATQQHVMMMHVLVELIIWISAKAKTVHAKRLTAVWMPRSRGIGGERSSWRGERVSEMKLQLRRFILTIHSHFWQLLCWWVLWFKGKIAFLLAL